MKTILVADDTLDLLEGVSELLQIEGYNVVTASNGQKAFEVFSTSKVDLVITDLLMPVMDGFELIREIRGTGSTIPIIVFSAKPPGENLDKVINLGANLFIFKPSPLEKILISVNDLLP